MAAVCTTDKRKLAEGDVQLGLDKRPKLGVIDEQSQISATSTGAQADVDEFDDSWADTPLPSAKPKPESVAQKHVDELDDYWADTPAASTKPMIALVSGGSAEAPKAASKGADEASKATTQDCLASASAELTTETNTREDNGDAKPVVEEKCVAKKYDPKTVFVANLSFQIQKEQFELDFEEHGTITRLDFLESRGIAFVTYETEAAAAEAVKLDGDEYWGRTLKVQLRELRDRSAGKCDKGKGEDSESVEFEAFVKCLPETVKEDAVRKHFADCGKIQSLRVPRKAEGQAKGVAFIIFQTAEALAKAVELNGKDFCGVALVVEKARGAETGKGKSKGKDKEKGKAKGQGKKGEGKKGEGKKGEGKGSRKGKGKDKDKRH